MTRVFYVYICVCGCVFISNISMRTVIFFVGWSYHCLSTFEPFIPGMSGDLPYWSQKFGSSVKTEGDFIVAEFSDEVLITTG